jgi:hypothetical protein
MADGTDLAVLDQEPDTEVEAEPTFTPATIHKLANADPQVILDRIAAGELLREIADEFGCSQPAVSQFIAKRVPKAVWARVRELSIAARLERSTQEMEQAEDQLMLARARESARLWMWRAERELPHLYGQRQQITHEVGNDLGDLLREARNRVAAAQTQVIDVTPNKSE